MTFKTDRLRILHKARRKEIEIVFEKVPEGTFASGLELGAGDGFQSKLLKMYISRRVCTEYNWNRLVKDDDTITYVEADAENIDKYFAAEEFDIVFSSNLLEHLPNPRRGLEGIHRILKDDGVTIHIMPNPTWKLSMLILFYPILLFTLPRRVLRKIRNRSDKKQILRENTTPGGMGNNPKFSNRERGFLGSRLFPVPHGAYKNNIEEIFKYRKKKWEKEFKDSDFEIITVIKGPFCFGYFYKILDSISIIPETLGLCTEYIYIAKKKNSIATSECLFTK